MIRKNGKNVVTRPNLAGDSLLNLLTLPISFIVIFWVLIPTANRFSDSPLLRGIDKASTLLLHVHLRLGSILTSLQLTATLETTRYFDASTTVGVTVLRREGESGSMLMIGVHCSVTTAVVFLGVIVLFSKEIWKKWGSNLFSHSIYKLQLLKPFFLFLVWLLEQTKTFSAVICFMWQFHFSVSGCRPNIYEVNSLPRRIIAGLMHRPETDLVSPYWCTRSDYNT